MATTDEPTRNGIDVSELEAGIEAVSDDPTTGSFTFRAETDWEGALKSEMRIDEFDHAGEPVDSRTFTLQGDEPEQILGERTGPNAVELLLAALGSCLSVGYAAHAAAMGIELTDVRLETAGEFDLRGFLGIDDSVRPGYQSMTCEAYLSADASEDDLAELHERVEAHSPLVDVIRNEVPLETRLNVE